MATVKLDLNTFSMMVNEHTDVSADTRCVLGEHNVQIGEKDAGWFGRGKITAPSSNKTQTQENNEVRTALLTALTNHYGKNGIPQAVMKSLVGSSCLGAGDMKTDAKGEVISGRPLTMRRIKAILAAVAENQAVDHAAVESDVVIEGVGFTEDGDHYVVNGNSADQIREHALSTLTKVCSCGNVSGLVKKVLGITGKKIVESFCKAVTEWAEKQPNIKNDAKDIKDRFNAFLNAHGKDYGYDEEQREFPKGAQFFNAFLGVLEKEKNITIPSVDFASIVGQLVKELATKPIDGRMAFLSDMPMHSFKFNDGSHKFEYRGGKTIFKSDDKDAISNMPANFALSETFDKDSDTPQVKVLRCGMAGTDGDKIPKHYETIAKAMILESSTLMKQINEHTGDDPVEISVPMFMFNAGDSLWKGSDQIKAFKVNIDGKDVDVKPTFHELYVPGTGNNTGDYFKYAGKTLASAESLLQLAKDRFAEGTNTAKIIKEIEEGIQYLKSLTGEDDPQIKKDGLYLQAYLCQLSARMAFLTSELGYVPCINCGHGRDRTGVMNTLIQMCAIGTIPPLTKDLRTLDDEMKRECSRMLVATGNFTIALQTSILNHPINLSQSKDGVEHELHDLFDIDELKRRVNEKGFGFLLKEIE